MLCHCPQSMIHASLPAESSVCIVTSRRVGVGCSIYDHDNSLTPHCCVNQEKDACFIPWVMACIHNWEYLYTPPTCPQSFLSIPRATYVHTTSLQYPLGLSPAHTHLHQTKPLQHLNLTSHLSCHQFSGHPPYLSLLLPAWGNRHC